MSEHSRCPISPRIIVKFECHLDEAFDCAEVHLELLDKSSLQYVEPSTCSTNGHQGVQDQIGVPVAVMAVVVAVVPR